MHHFIMEEVLDYVKRNPYENTHFIIGGASRTPDINKYLDEPNIQQIIEPWKDLTQPTRYIHFDPHFDTQIEDNFIESFLNSKKIGFTYDNSDGMHIWRSTDNIIEMIFISLDFYYSSSRLINDDLHDWFLKDLSNIILQINSKLIVQDYSGTDTNIIFKMLYEQSPNKQAFKNNILFDFTYGNNGCNVDFSQNKPIYDPYGNFINIQLITFDELCPLIHIHPIIKTHVHNYCIKEYRKIIDIIPVDYRRKLLNIPIHGYMEKYTNDTSFDEIINILKIELDPIIKIFQKVGIMTDEKEELLNELYTNYKNYTLTSSPSIYHWTTNFLQICRL